MCWSSRILGFPDFRLPTHQTASLMQNMSCSHGGCTVQLETSNHSKNLYLPSYPLDGTLELQQGCVVQSSVTTYSPLTVSYIPYIGYFKMNDSILALLSVNCRFYIVFSYSFSLVPISSWYMIALLDVSTLQTCLACYMFISLH